MIRRAWIGSGILPALLASLLGACGGQVTGGGGPGSAGQGGGDSGGGGSGGSGGAAGSGGAGGSGGAAGGGGAAGSGGAGGAGGMPDAGGPPLAGKAPWCAGIDLGCDGTPKPPGLYNKVCVKYKDGKYSTTGDGTTKDRQYTIWVPKGYDGSKPVPLFAWLHGSDVGSGSGADYISAYTDNIKALGSFPDKQGLIWLAPISNPLNWGKHEWEFGIETIEAVSCIYNVDPKRIYLSGFSSGGGGAMVVGIRYGSDHFAAFGSWSTGNPPGTLGDPCGMSRKVPVFLGAGSGDSNLGQVKGWNDRFGSCGWTDATKKFHTWMGGHAYTAQVTIEQELPFFTMFTRP